MSSSSSQPHTIFTIIAIVIILLVALVSVNYLFPDTGRPNEMDLKVQKLDGTTLDTTSLQGKTLIMEFMATWCDFCLETSQNFAKVLATQHYPNVVFLSISVDPSHDTSTVIKDFIWKYNFTDYVFNGSQWLFLRDVNKEYTHYMDGTIPHTFLVNNNSRILADQIGILSYQTIISWLSGNFTSSASSDTTFVTNSSSAIASTNVFIIVTKNA